MPENSDLVQKELAYFIEKLPECRLKILYLYAGDEDFKTICDDHWYCLEFLTQSMLQKTYAHSLLVKEYSTICLALEEEALGYIQRKQI